MYVNGDYEVDIKDNEFVRCAGVIGGAIAFTSTEPKMEGNIFTSNSATLYGADVAAYPV